MSRSRSRPGVRVRRRYEPRCRSRSLGCVAIALCLATLLFGLRHHAGGLPLARRLSPSPLPSQLTQFFQAPAAPAAADLQPIIIRSTAPQSPRLKSYVPVQEREHPGVAPASRPLLPQSREAESGIVLTFPDAIALMLLRDHSSHHQWQWQRLQQPAPAQPLSFKLPAGLSLQLFQTATTPSTWILTPLEWQHQQAHHQTITRAIATLATQYATWMQAQQVAAQTQAAIAYAHTHQPGLVGVLTTEQAAAQQWANQLQQQLCALLGLPATTRLVAQPETMLIDPRPLLNEKLILQRSHRFQQLRQRAIAPGKTPLPAQTAELNQRVKAAIAQISQTGQAYHQAQQDAIAAQRQWQLTATVQPAAEQTWQAYRQWQATERQVTQTLWHYAQAQWQLSQLQGTALHDWGLQLTANP